MTTVADLDRLEALAERLQPLQHAARGELVRAQAWNVLVGAVIEIARAVITRQQGVGVGPHEHPEQVKLGWLEPKLRALIERGPLADPTLATQRLETERKIARFGDRLEAYRELADSLRDRVSELLTHDLDRQAALTELQREVEGRIDGRDEIAALRKSLDTISEDVQRALQAADRLSVNGEAPDIGDLQQRLAALEALGERLRMPDGELLDAGALERRLTELTNTLVTEDEMDRALDARPGRLSDEQIATLRTEVSSQVSADFRSQIEASEQRLRNENTERFAEIDAVVARAVSDARAELLQELRTLNENALASFGEELRATLEQNVDERLSQNRAQLEQLIAQQVSAAEQRVSSQLEQTLRDNVDEAVAPLLERQSALERQVGDFQTQLTRHERALTTQSSRIEEVSRQAERQRGDLRAALRSELDNRIAEVETQLRDRVDTRLESSLTDLSDAIEGNASVSNPVIDRLGRVLRGGGGRGPG